MNVWDGEPKEEEPKEENQLGIYPLSIVLNSREYKEFQMYKRENRLRTDTEAFKQLFTSKENDQ